MKDDKMYLIDMLRSAVTGEVVDIPQDIDMIKLFNLAGENRVDNILYTYFLAKNPQGNGVKYLKDAYLKAIAKETNQEMMANIVMDELEKAQIPHMALKGFVTKHLYPSPDLRQSTDVDLYVPSGYSKKTAEIMEKLNFEFDEKVVGRGMHDSYFFPPFTSIEVHKSLMSPDFPKWCRMCEELLSNIKPVDGYKSRYEFSKEDFYLYMQLHSIKHLKYTSCGIKAIIDIWIYLSKYFDELDWDYINSMLEKYGILEIDRNLRALADYWFNKIEPEKDIIYKLSDYIITSGAFGNLDQYYSDRMTTDNIFKKLWRMYFIPIDEMEIIYPKVKEKHWLIGFYRLHRAFSALLRRKDTEDEGNSNGKIDKKQAAALSNFKKDLGL